MKNRRFSWICFALFAFAAVLLVGVVQAEGDAWAEGLLVHDQKDEPEGDKKKKPEHPEHPEHPEKPEGDEQEPDKKDDEADDGDDDIAH